jgi:hypothetical protein
MDSAIMKKLGSFLILFSLLSSTNLYAQDNSGRDDRLEYRKWRITLIPPISTNGAKTLDYTARYSINLIGGWHGGVERFEFGTLFNYTSEYADGLQIAGITNISAGDANGLRIAGITNITKGDANGLMVAGFVNSSRGDINGLQLSGLMNLSGSDLSGLSLTPGINLSGGYVSGLSVAGVANIADKSVDGLFAAGGLNVGRDDLSGLSAAGIGNIAGNSIDGLSAAGFMNISNESLSGLILAGGVNISKNIEGLTAAGFMNLSEYNSGLSGAGINISKYSEGLMIGALNFSREVSGMQIGLINLAEDMTGAPIGLFSLYGNGRKNLDLRIHDAGFTEVGLNLGTYRVNNMLIFGYNQFIPDPVYRIGWAIGVEQRASDHYPRMRSDDYYLNREFSITHQFEGDYDKTLNLIYSYRHSIGKHFGNGFSIYAGPSFNMMVSRVDNSDTYTWYSLWSPTRKGRQYRFWIGATFGIRFFKQKRLPSKPENNDWSDFF